MPNKYYFLISYNDNKLTSRRHAKHKKKMRVKRYWHVPIRCVCDYITLPVTIRKECV